MNKVIRKIGIAFAGLLAAISIGSPALADDTELLLVAPNQSPAPKPNILFIIDSSGSMDTEENSRKIYESTISYGGDCDTDSLYWSKTGTVPSCSGNNKYFDKSAFVCASAKLQIDGIGRYTNLMAQYRDSGIPLIGNRWLPIEPGNDTGIVECRKDSGLHGDGTAGEVYAQRGGGLPPFTSNNLLEVAWGNYPLSEAITVFDGNYLNYLTNPVFEDQERIDIVKDVTTAVLNSIENVNVGVMRFNDGQGGPVILGMTDLDTNRADVLAAIDGIGAAGVTPLSETLYEAARYWRGLPAYYGELVDEHPTDPNALASDNPEVYKQPDTQVCAKNFNVLLTDGQPVSDAETPDLVDNLPDWFDTQGMAGCTGTEMGDCLDDIAHYLFADDISTDPGPQIVTTHTIGFAIDLDILEDAAAASEGTYFQADDVESLTIALLDIVNDIQDRSLSFAAPAVAVNTFNRTQNLNELFLTTFAARESTHWPGNLKKYQLKGGEIVDKYEKPAVNPATGFFKEDVTSFWSSDGDGNEVTEGGAVENMPDPSIRKLYTNNTSNDNLTAGVNALSPANEGNFSNADFGLTGSAEEP
ncbi:MAG: VWA domain-containing protein, partial [Woeseiaceae bacterium]|nr:VWA domain-containing protein [Woeseiaceae bacterium]